MHRKLQRTYLSAWHRTNGPRSRLNVAAIDELAMSGQAPEALDRKVARIQRSGSPLGLR